MVRSIAWQILGSAATLAAALWLSWRLGLAALGEFGLAKSWFDAGAALAAFGLPQGLLHLLYRRAVPAQALRGWLLRWVAVLTLLCAPASLLLLASGLRLAAAVMISLPFSVAHLLARSLLLPRQSAEGFGVATALPALMVLSGVMLYAALGWVSGFDVMLLGVAAGSASISVAMAWPRGSTRDVPDWSRRELWQVSLQSYLQQALGALLTAALLSAVAAGSQGAVALGQASLGLQLYQAFVVLAGIASPLLFDRLARQDLPQFSGGVRAIQRRLAVLVALLMAVAIVVLADSSTVARPAWLLPLALMLPAGVAATAARLASTVLLARGEYRELSLQAIGRLLLAIACLLPSLAHLPAAAAVAAALLVTELATWSHCNRRLRAAS